jgi:hypothetical protein
VCPDHRISLGWSGASPTCCRALPFVGVASTFSPVSPCQLKPGFRIGFARTICRERRENIRGCISAVGWCGLLSLVLFDSFRLRPDIQFSLSRLRHPAGSAARRITAIADQRRLRDQQRLRDRLSAQPSLVVGTLRGQARQCGLIKPSAERRSRRGSRARAVVKRRCPARAPARRSGCALRGGRRPWSVSVTPTRPMDECAWHPALRSW